MDFLNQAFAQLKDLFDGMTPGSRITAGLLLAVVVVSLGYLFTNSDSGNNVYLFEGSLFSGPELAAMEAALGEAGLECHTDSGRIRVPRGKKYEYMAALAKASAMPKESGDIIKSALENQSYFTSGKQNDERLKAASQQEYARIIEKMGGVSRASVLYASHVKPGFLKEEVVTATANVDMLGSRTVDQALADAICSTIMGGVGGISPENIRVVDNATGIVFHGNSEDLSGGGGSLASDTQYWQKYHQDLILRQLRDIQGVSVSCNVTLSKIKSSIEKSINHDPKTLTVDLTEKTSTRTFEGAEPAGRPGAVGQANTARSLGNSQGRGSREDTDDTETQQTNIAAKSTQTTTESLGRVVERVTASISIPYTYFEDIWHKDNDVAGEDPKDPTKAEVEQLQQTEVAKIEDIVAPLLLDTAGVADPTELVQVRVYQPIAIEPIPDPGMAANAVTWLGQSWQTVGLICLAFFSLLMIRSMVKSAGPVRVVQASVEQPGSKAGSQSGDEDQAADEPPGPQLVRFGTSGRSLKDELTDLVAEDPDAAANVLRNWIGHVSNAA